MKRMTIVLVILVIILAFVKIKEYKQGDRSFKSELVSVDSAMVNCIEIQPKKSTETVKINRKGNKWMIDLGNKSVQAEASMPNELLKILVSLKPTRVAATTKDKWAEYELTDSLASRIKVWDNKTKLADFLIGKFSYNQQNQSITSFVRNSSENEVYAVDGYLSMMFNRDIDTFRDNNILIGDPKEWTRLEFNYPADSSFVLEKLNNIWMIDGQPADSIKVQAYFSKISRLNDDAFYDDVLSDSEHPDYRVEIEGEHFSPIEIKSFTLNDDLVTLSSQNLGNQFNSDKVKLTLFVPKETFKKTEK